MKKTNGIILMMLGVIVLISTILPLTVSCTQNQQVKMFGGTMTYNLDKGQKLVNATWKDEDLWILTRPFREGEREEIYKFTEKSSFGVLQGEITFVEYRPNNIGITTPEMDRPPN